MWSKAHRIMASSWETRLPGIVLALIGVALLFAYVTVGGGHTEEAQAIGTARSKIINGRVAPSFIIIGAQKSGTTSLFNYLVQHPHVISLKTPELSAEEAMKAMSEEKSIPIGDKELRFFDRMEEGSDISEYLNLFPTVEVRC